MPEHDLAMYSIGLILLVVLALMIALGLLMDARDKRRLDRAYAQSRANIVRLSGVLGESEAAAILRQHQMTHDALNRDTSEAWRSSGAYRASHVRNDLFWQGVMEIENQRAARQ